MRKLILTFCLALAVLLGNAETSFALPECKDSPTEDRITPSELDKCEGTKTCDSGNEYLGEWRNASPHGKGVFTWALSGGKYVGGWKNGKIHGQGIYTSTYVTYIGKWKNGYPRGKGIFTYPNGNKYFVKWEYGNRQGRKGPKLKFSFYGLPRPRQHSLGDLGLVVKSEVQKRANFCHGPRYPGGKTHMQIKAALQAKLDTHKKIGDKGKGYQNAVDKLHELNRQERAALDLISEIGGTTAGGYHTGETPEWLLKNQGILERKLPTGILDIFPHTRILNEMTRPGTFGDFYEEQQRLASLPDDRKDTFKGQKRKNVCLPQIPWYLCSLETQPRPTRMVGKNQTIFIPLTGHITEKFATLKELYDQGLIDRPEYQAKMKELLRISVMKHSN